MAVSDLIGVRGKILKNMCNTSGIKREFERFGVNGNPKGKVVGILVENW